MKLKMPSAIPIALILGFTLQTFSQGVIVPGGVSYAGLNFLGGYEIRVLQNPTNGNYTGFMLTPQGKTPPSSLHINTFSYSHYVDEGVRVFMVSSNDPVSLQPILGQVYLELGFAPNYVFESGKPFYVGVYTGNIFPQNGIYPDPVFGWARLVNNQGVIELLDGALEYGGGGINVGTQNIIPIPEPDFLSFSILGAVTLIWRRLKIFDRRNSGD